MFWKRKNKTKISEQDLLKILTVKAVEEAGENIFNPMALSKANIIALSSKTDFEFVIKRANYLFSLLPQPFQATLNFTGIKGVWIRLLFIISFITGIFSNYLGNLKTIQVIYNPLTILLAWNLLVYIYLILKSFIKINPPEIKTDNILPEIKDENKDENGNNKKIKTKKPGFLVNILFSWFLKSTVKIRSGLEDKKVKVLFLKKIIPLFWEDYKNLAGRSLVYKFKVLLNINSIGLVLGALSGIYIRGLFFKYNVIWESTFIDNPETIRFILNIIFGPANYLIYGNLISTNQVMQLLSESGMPAASWIHIMSLTTVLYVVLPRTLLAIFYAVKAKYYIRNIDINDPYFANHVIKSRDALMDEVKREIEEILRKKIDRTAISISDFVVHDYFDKIIVPILLDFRDKGGKIKELEKRLKESQKEFEPILVDYLSQVQEDFRESVLTQINLFLGRNFDIDINTTDQYKPQSNAIDKDISGNIASNISDTLGGTFVTTIALTVGSLTGGLGKSLGIAILSSLLGVSGPIGLLIGAVATAVTLGGFYKVNKDKITDYIKNIPVPPAVAAMTLTDKKIEKARMQTREHTIKEVKKMLEPKIDIVVENILNEITG